MKRVGVLIAAFYILTAGVSVKAADSVFEGIVFYVPHRIVDMFDIFSISVGLGPTIRAKVFTTRAFAFGAGLGAEARAIKQINRQYGFGLESGWDASFMALSTEGKQRTESVGSVKDFLYYSSGIPSPSENIYKYFEGARDYWAIGTDAGVGVVAFSFELHPIEIADFVTGWFFMDLKDDDFGMQDVSK